MLTKQGASRLAASFLMGCSVTAISTTSIRAAEQGAAAPRVAIDEIVVTASPLERSRFDVVQATSILSGDSLADEMRASLGETLSREPGVTSTFFGPVASRPIIRGFDGDRIRVLFDGVGGVDASSVSPDHEVAGDASGAERIEVLRGPATLLYGTSAVGGVVNVDDGRVPDEWPTADLEGELNFGYGTNANEKTINGKVNAGFGDAQKGFVLHLDKSYRDFGDYTIKGFASEEAEEEGIRGRVENSDGRIHGGGGGVSYIWETGSFGAAYSRFDSNYGSPAGHHHHEEDETDEEHEEETLVRLDLEQNRFDVKGELDELGDILTTARFRFSTADYKHTELEDEETGTVFSNNGVEGRLDLIHTLSGDMEGVIGVHYRDRDFSAIGEEAFVPETSTRQWAGFALETAILGKWRLEGGARLEHTSVNNNAASVKRTFTSSAVSAAAAYEFLPDTLAGLTVSWSERPPTAEELFSNGPHLATSQFELGDPGLKEEQAVNAEITLRRRVGALTGSISVYSTWFDGFIFPGETGATEDDLPVFQFQATDARFSGFEAEAAVDVVRRDDFVLSLDGTLDYVRATDTVADRPLPRIPPLRYRLGLNGEWRQLSARMEVQGANEQDRTAPLESSTGGYAFLNTTLSYRPFEDKNVRLVLQGRNLTNAFARPHTSFIKDDVPLPGRDIRFSVQTSF